MHVQCKLILCTATFLTPLDLSIQNRSNFNQFQYKVFWYLFKHNFVSENFKLCEDICKCDGAKKYPLYTVIQIQHECLIND